MKFNTNKQYTTIAVYSFLVIIGSITFFYLINEHTTVSHFFGGFVKLLTPFIYGAVLAYVLNPILNWLEEKVFPKIFKNRIGKRGRRALGVLFTLIFAVAVVAIFLAILIPQILESIENLSQSIYAFLPRAQIILTDFLEKYGTNEIVSDIFSLLGIDASDPALALQKLAARSYTFLVRLTQALPDVLSGLLRLTSGLLDVVVGIIISIYLLLSKEVFYAQIKKFLFAFFPKRFTQALLNLTHDSNTIFCGFISGKILDSAIIGVLCFIGCTLLKMPYTVLVSFIVGVTNIIPYFGPFIGAIPSIFIIMIADPFKSLIFAIFVLILQQLDGNVIGPKILGQSTGLSSIWVIFAVTFFGGMFGFVGMLIGVPTFAVIYALIRNVSEYLLARKGMSTQTVTYASEQHPIFQKVEDHSGYEPPRTGVDVCDLDGKNPEMQKHSDEQTQEKDPPLSDKESEK